MALGAGWGSSTVRLTRKTTPDTCKGPEIKLEPLAGVRWSWGEGPHEHVKFINAKNRVFFLFLMT